MSINRLLGYCMLGGALSCVMPISFAQEEDLEADAAQGHLESWRELRETRREERLEILREENPALAEELEALQEERAAFMESFPDKYPEIAAMMQERREAIRTMRQSRQWLRQRGWGRGRR